MLPIMSFFTGEKATEPRRSCARRVSVCAVMSCCRDERQLPNMVVSDSAASRNSVVEIALPLSASIGTLVKDALKVSRYVPPWGACAVAILSDCRMREVRVVKQRETSLGCWVLRPEVNVKG